jgi:mannose/fructose-specific phosphotransferase system component IIA
MSAINSITNAAGLVLLFETGLVLFDLADIVGGGPNTPAGSVVHQNRGEWLLASVSTHNMHSALWTF